MYYTSILRETAIWTVARVGVDCAPEIPFQALIDAFGLPVRLGVVCRGIEQFSARAGEELAPECAGEDAIAARDDGAGDAVQLDDLIPEDLGDLRSLERVPKRNEVRRFGQPIHNYHD